MERIRSRIALALGGAARVRGGGLLALAAFGLLVGVGCTGPRALRMKDVLPAGWVSTTPASQIVCAFNPQVQHLPDPSKDGVLGAGLSGQLYLIAADGSFTDVNGDLYVMADDITVRPPGHPPAVPEIWHFDAATLRKLKTKDERFGSCYALFLPYPPNWKDVTQLRISTQYKPKGDPAKEPTLPGPPQTVLLDFTPPGEQSNVWLKKDPDAKPTAPVAMKGMPNVSRDIARGGLGAALTGPQSNGTALAGGTPPATPVTPAGGPTPPVFNPFAAPTGPAPPPPTTPPLPPPMQFTPDRPQTTMRGPHGETLNVTAMALPPGQTVPAGWVKQPDGSIQPPNVAAASGQQPQPHQPQFPPQQGQVQQTWPAQGGQTAVAPADYRPASSNFVPASQQNQSRIQHGTFAPPFQPVTPQQPVTPVQPPPVVNPQQPLTPVQPQLPPNVPGSLPAIPPTAARSGALPPVSHVPGNVPAMPAMSGGFAGPAQPINLPPSGGVVAPPPVVPSVNFDTSSPVGAWANPSVPPVSPVPPPPPGGAYAPTVVPPPPPGSYDTPNVPVVIKRPG